ncbi:GNAT family N-acetyltransferase [Clostridium sp. OM02-18AC]|uniref:GNAT family N-acetyltransferase n=1 Tax=Clostridium sp. OM02-18AC TaxID=2292311 RepID=UPI000E47FB49|nr:GNAT family N-acetyltransferase [Clostridium sp. OM02-18AC]RHV69858.1 GNAT family N-acetyltransferase [Clostridium sp. OM02-18AC]
MEKNDIQIRVASEADAEALLAIYTPYVVKTAITFEYEPPTLEEFRGRIRHTLQKYPYLVAEKNGKILGYAYAGVFHEREAYSWAVETSIYVDETLRHSGVGGKLNRAMEAVCRAMGILNMEACIAVPEAENDEYLTRNSVDYHAHIGYRLVGEFYQCGYKFGRWYNMVWMEKMIGEHQDEMEMPVWFPDLKQINEILE